MPRSDRRASIDDRVRVQHLLDAARKASMFVSGKTRADFDADEMLQHALLSLVTIIGEAAANVSDNGRARVPDLPWGQIVAIRHILVHVYWGVDKDRLWSTATQDAPVLISAIESAIIGWPLPSGGTSGT